MDFLKSLFTPSIITCNNQLYVGSNNHRMSRSGASGREASASNNSYGDPTASPGCRREVQANTSRLQIAIERLRRQQEQVDRLAAQLQQTQNETQMLKSSQPQMEEQTKQMENQIGQAQTEEHRSMMQAQFKEFKNNLAQQVQRETQLEDLQTKLMAQLQAERSKLVELNNQLDSLQREMESQQLAVN
jgi:chromosome segregation ATPase